jgi:hypothetical protein
MAINFALENIYMKIIIKLQQHSRNSTHLEEDTNAALNSSQTDFQKPLPWLLNKMVRKL